MRNYTLTNVKSSLHEIESKKTGKVLHRVKNISKEYTEKLGKTGGMRLVQTRNLFDILPNVISSKTDMAIVSYIIQNNSKIGVVKMAGKSKPAGINYLAEHFCVSRKKIGEVIKRLIDSDIIKKHKRELVVNPHIISPHTTSNKTLHILQEFWDSEFTNDISGELIEAEEEYAAFKIEQNSINGM